MIEDLAVKDDSKSQSYRYLVNQKGETEVIKRKQFLEMVK